MARPSILFIDHSFHRKTRSSEFLVELLRGMGEVDLVWDDSWQPGQPPVDYRARAAASDIVIVLQLANVIEHLAKTRHPNLVFVPMYDGAWFLPKRFWQSIANVKVLCFCAALYETCLRQRLHARLVRYFPPVRAELAPPLDGRRLFVWHRQARPAWRDVAAFVPGAQFDRIHLHQVPDPGSEPAEAPTPWERQHLNITESTWFESKQAFEALLDGFNYYLAPREREGIGQSFLDAMARGLVVLSPDFPTANEYIVDGVNGYLLGPERERFDLPESPELRDSSLHLMRKGRAIWERQQAGMLRFLVEPAPKRPWKLPPWLQREWHGRQAPHVGARATHASPRVAVVVFGRDDAAGIARSLASVQRQGFAALEQLVVDTADLQAAIADGLSRTRGEYLVFLPAGDEFFGSAAIEDLMQYLPPQTEVAYGHHFELTRRMRREVRLAADLRAGRASALPALGSTFIRRDLLARVALTKDDPLAKDHQLLLRLGRCGARLYHSTTFVSLHADFALTRRERRQRQAQRQAVAARSREAT